MATDRRSAGAAKAFVAAGFSHIAETDDLINIYTYDGKSWMPLPSKVTANIGTFVTQSGAFQTLSYAFETRDILYLGGTSDIWFMEMNKDLNIYGSVHLAPVVQGQNLTNPHVDQWAFVSNPQVSGCFNANDGGIWRYDLAGGSWFSLNTASMRDKSSEICCNQSLKFFADAYRLDGTLRQNHPSQITIGTGTVLGLVEGRN